MSKKWKTEVEKLTKLLKEEKKTLKEVGMLYGITTQRMSQVVKELFPDWSRQDYGASLRKQERLTQQTAAWQDRYNRSSYNNLTDLEYAWAKSFTRKKQNAKHTGWEWDLKMSDVVWPTRCPILGLELDWFAESRQENSPSFYRIDCNKGYVKGNVMITSWRANRIKNDGTANEHRAIAEFLDRINRLEE